ncbi:hypothetical protein [Mucilaginibacter rubeus]|uniref:hypothetical protein n=1 Tax=Mucilaginibacter rubeus TaxID=2027860 RepID=UPI001666AEEF|nr:hypothetical protein [Mucilaginibacter rubeus]GGA91734.1 hypothetical protein GCM10011500_04270 [Mucilaginibacter rubeus]
MIPACLANTLDDLDYWVINTRKVFIYTTSSTELTREGIGNSSQQSSETYTPLFKLPGVISKHLYIF